MKKLFVSVVRFVRDRLAALCFIVTGHEMNDAVRGGNEKAVEIFSELFDFVSPRHAVDF